MSHAPYDPDPKVQAVLDKIHRRDLRTEHIFRRLLHILEHIVATVTVCVLIVALFCQIAELVFHGGFNGDLTNFLHHILTIVVGLEFVRMIIDTTPSNILEVLTVAITRHVILSHDDPWSNLACVACIAGLFATRRFLIRSDELKEELVESE